MAQETEEDKGFLQSTADFFKNLDYKQLAEESMPIVGENIIIGDIKENLKEGSLGSAALNTGALALGVFPLLGDIAAKPLRAAAKQLRKKDIGEATKLIDDDVASEVWKEKNRLPESQRQKRIPKVQEAAQQLSEGKITSKEYRHTVKTNQPIELITKENFPTMPTKTEIVGALKATDPRKVKTGIVGLNKTIADGTRVGSRLDIPAYDNYDKWIVSLHDGTKRGGEALGYGQTAVLKNVEFVSSAKGGLNIAKGKSKATIARIHGDYYNAEPENVYEAVRDLLGSSEWTQVGMNPFRHSYFYDKATGLPVTRADEVLQVGPLVLARGVKKPTISELKQLKIKTSDGKIRAFNEGGPVMALEEQTEMAFRDKPPRVDPVSGNEVPPGALPSEVRDDIPARLSEGEYVVPADVLQYYGIKFFEDLRSKAKTKLAGLEEDGRMGGEPMNDASMEGMEEMPFNLDELKTYEDDAEGGVQGFYEGGITSGVAPDTAVKTYINAEGSRLYIRFVNGIAIPPVPPGYVEEGVGEDAAPVVDPIVVAEQERLERERNEDPEKDQSIWDGTKPPRNMTTGELAMAMAIHSGGGKIKADFLPGIAIAKGAMKLLGGSNSMSNILLKEANRRVVKAEELGLNPTEISVTKNLAGLDPKNINTWRNTISLPVDKGGAATTLNKFSDIFKGRGNTTRTGTGIIDFTDFDQGEQIQKMRRDMAKADQDARKEAQVKIDEYKNSEQSVLEQVEENREEQQEETKKREETFQAEKTAAAAKTKEAPTSSGSAYSGSSGGRREFGMNKGGLASKRKKKK